MSVQAVRKVSLVALRESSEAVMASLHNAGVLHINTCANTIHDDVNAHINETTQNLARQEKAIAFLKRFLATPHAIPAKNQSPEELLDRVYRIADECEKIDTRIDEVKNLIATYAPFGEFVEHHGVIEQTGYRLKLARLETNDLAQIAPGLSFEIVGRSGDFHLVAILLTPTQEAGVAAFDPPPASIPQLRAELSALQTKSFRIKEEASRYAYQSRKLETLYEQTRERQERLRELTKTYAEDELIGISGYVLQKDLDRLKAALENHLVALTLEEPTREDDVPVMLENPKMVRGFEAVVKAFTGINYFEKDKTGVVFLLFVVFGALCLLDAGYGFLLLVVGYIVAIKKNRELGQVFVWTGAASTIVGLLCGQVFGLTFAKDILLNIPPLLGLATDPMTCFKFSLVMGVAAMGLSYMVAIYQNGIATHATGCLFALLGGITLMLDKSGLLVGRFYDPGLVLEWIAVGWFSFAVISWLFFPDPVFGQKRVANILWMLYSGPLGLVQDVLSHMRLFGIALSGSILALVINRICGILPAPLGLLFAPIGHFTIFLLSLLSLYIHTNRLIFLEFGTKCMKGGTTYFKPFARRI